MKITSITVRVNIDVSLRVFVVVQGLIKPVASNSNVHVKDSYSLKVYSHHTNPPPIST